MPKPEEAKVVKVDYRAVEGLPDTDFRALALQAAELKGTIRECERRLDGYDRPDGVHEEGIVEQIKLIVEALEAPPTVDVEGKLQVVQVAEGKPGRKFNPQKLILRMKGAVSMADIEACMEKTAPRKAHLKLLLPGADEKPEVV